MTLNWTFTMLLQATTAPDSRIGWSKWWKNLRLSSTLTNTHLSLMDEPKPLDDGLKPQSYMKAETLNPPGA